VVVSLNPVPSPKREKGTLLFGGGGLVFILILCINNQSPCPSQTAPFGTSSSPRGNAFA